MIATNPEGALTFVFETDGSVTTLGWEANVVCVGGTYTLSFDINYEGGVNPEDMLIDSETEIGALPVVTRDNYTFAGWFIGEEEITETTVWNYTSNQTAVAEWEIIVGIEDEKIARINIYPNPAIDMVSIEGVKVIELQVIDLTGRVVLQEQNKQKVNISALNNGAYFMKIVDAENNVHVSKLVKK